MKPEYWGLHMAEHLWSFEDEDGGEVAEVTIKCPTPDARCDCETRYRPAMLNLGRGLERARRAKE